MRVWELTGLEVDEGHPQVLHSTPQGRTIAIHLTAGSALGEHEVREGAWLVAAFEPGERHAVTALEDACSFS
jgi:hypothetical protein